MVEVEGEDSLACQRLFRGDSMGSDSVGGVCLDVAEDADTDNRMRERWWRSARGVWELRRDAHHEPSNEATVLRGIEWRWSR